MAYLYQTYGAHIGLCFKTLGPELPDPARVGTISIYDFRTAIKIPSQREVVIWLYQCPSCLTSTNPLIVKPSIQDLHDQRTVARQVRKDSVCGSIALQKLLTTKLPFRSFSSRVLFTHD